MNKDFNVDKALETLEKLKHNPVLFKDAIELIEISLLEYAHNIAIV